MGLSEWGLMHESIEYSPSYPLPLLLKLPATYRNLLNIVHVYRTGGCLSSKGGGLCYESRSSRYSDKDTRMEVRSMLLLNKLRSPKP